MRYVWLSGSVQFFSLDTTSSKDESGTAEIRVTVSAGISTSDTPGVFNGKELLRLADSALLLAKTNGRNRIEIYKPAVS